MKKQCFFENAKLLNDKFGIVPLMYGSLGLEYITNENLNADDLDILIPKVFIAERWDDLKSFLMSEGYVLLDEHEHTFQKNGVFYSYAFIEELSPFAGIELSDIKQLCHDGIQFMVLSLEQYLKVYRASAKDGYRINVREKKDIDKIAFIENHLKPGTKRRLIMSKKLVAYFSASGVTAKVAETLSEAIGADIYAIEPEVPYTKADLDWRDANSRSTVEMKDPSSRPAIKDKRDNMADYDTIYLGFPIWWYVAPTIINTFLESYDFTGKTIITFATSGSSGMGKTNEVLKTSCLNATLLEGKVLKASSTKAELSKWAENVLK